MNILEQLKQAPDAVLIIQKFEQYLQTERQKRAEFLEMIHDNIKAEFINGEILLHSPVRMAHLRASSRIALPLLDYVEQHDAGFVGIEKMMIGLSRNFYEPDIVFFRKAVAQTFTPDQKVFPAPDLVVEILSESTRKQDYGVKFQDYAAHGISEYWIVDTEAEVIEQYLLKGEQFELYARLGVQDRLNSWALPQFQLEVAKIFA